MAIKCHCGHQIVRRDVLQRNFHVRVFGPSFIYLKFRCTRCRRVGERFVEQSEWDDALLREGLVGSIPATRPEFAHLGAITVDEAIDFHFALDQPDLLRELARDWPAGSRCGTPAEDDGAA